MSKRALKQNAGVTENFSLVDTDRIMPKANGGTYEPENVRILEPTAHMERHETLRTREENLELLKSIFDDRVQTMKLLMKVNNQLLAYERRTDHKHPDTAAFLTNSVKPFEERLATIDRSLVAMVKAYAKQDAFVACCMKVRGLGPITIAALTVYVDLSKANCASALWKYTGLHAASHERYTKGETSGGNKTLRTVLYNTALAMMKDRKSPYRLVYDNMKHRLESSEKITKTRNTQGHLIEAAWKDTKPSHRHGAALRAIMKHLLSDYWFVGREMAGLPTRPLYVEEKLGHTSIVRPRDRGWNW